MFPKVTNKRRAIALTGTAVACLIAFGTVLSPRGNGFTLIERQFAFDPVEVNFDQAAHVVFSNTFGSQAIHVSIVWTYGITGQPIGTAFQADVMPGHGVVALLPAVQTPPSTNGACCSQPVIATVTLSPAVGAGLLPTALAQQIRASLDVVDNATQHVTQSHGLPDSLLLAAQ
jgi:hypothetical protein